jgi:hypothetical protein
MNNPKNWKTILNNYQLMKDPHCERDAQNWHIIGFDLVSMLVTAINFDSSTKSSSEQV